MTLVDAVAVAAAVLFALATGMNDGGVLVAVGSQSSRLRPVTVLAVLVAMLVGVPMLFGHRVIEVLSEGLVAGGADGRAVGIGAVLSAVLVVVVLSWRGLPTSLAVALVGGLVGSGWGRGLPVAWPTAAVVLVVALLAPVGAALLAGALHRVVGVAGRVDVRVIDRCGLVALAAAYAANSGQKMLAAFALVSGAQAAGGAGTGTGLAAGDLALVALAFSLGSVLSVRRMGRTLGSGVRSARPYDVAITQWGAAVAVVLAARAGVPVSMTQSLAGAAVGTGMRHGPHRVRWPQVSRLAAAWAVTLPVAVAVGALLGRVA